ncbi:Long-chain-fatty-acid--CoA ligase FadD13 [Ascidiaceihabitans donghaensis]|uniref:Long-chain-fatty-acid--CoA ligase FadD13 n=1 Tax=Ascidiaceihabitans donghaensis TaxID=1510460 RepID=A0A2R8BC40_9RHOB|nr:Long-chain-fatty-acid--CoA ligase FadD13 [Ascidiaceihabitans donghaensis]
MRYLPLERLDGLDPEIIKPIPRDGETMGEVMFRVNVVMKGHFRSPSATRQAFQGGWFHSGDLGAVHPDGYIQLKDHSKDIIISGGENVFLIEVEEMHYSYPAIDIATVVAMPHERWGETPRVFIELAPGHEIDTVALRTWCRDRLAPYKVPGRFVETTIFRISTGKIQKFALREHVKDLAAQS